MESRELCQRKLDEARKEIAQLRHRELLTRNKLSVAERKARTRRLVIHGANLEHVFPFVKELEAEETLAFLEQLTTLPGAGELIRSITRNGGNWKAE